MNKIYATAALSALAVIGLNLWSHYGTIEDVKVKVTKTERTCDTSGECRYLVFTPQEVFENTDSWMALKFDSSDVYAEIEEGKFYTLTVNRHRVPLLSWYRNVLEVGE